jgi:hypothetical protein
MGYRTIAVLERIAIALDGQLLGLWQPTSTPAERYAEQSWPEYAEEPQITQQPETRAVAFTSAGVCGPACPHIGLRR